MGTLLDVWQVQAIMVLVVPAPSQSLSMSQACQVVPREEEEAIHDSGEEDLARYRRGEATGHQSIELGL